MPPASMLENPDPTVEDVDSSRPPMDQRVKRIQSALAAFQAELQRIENHPVSVQADIHSNIFGPTTKKLSVSINLGTDKSVETKWSETTTTKENANPPPPDQGGRHPSVASAHTDESRERPRDLRPNKRARTDREGSGPLQNPNNGSAAEAASLRDTTDVLTYLKVWHEESRRQGGWLFDTLNAIVRAQKDDTRSIERNVAEAQHVLGQSINSAFMSQMTELANIAKLLPWLEQCRKTDADNVRIREERWRTSSATFQDQSRHAREQAEARLESKLEWQRKLLVKLAEANGVDLSEDEDDEKRSEASLGEQLAAQLAKGDERATRGKADASKDDPIQIS
jgi:hypothetical protein